MNMNNTTKVYKPCLVDTGQGLSVLYKERFIYSKFNPIIPVEKLVHSVEIRENTLILCCSPVLGYGLKTLESRLPANCFVLVIEADFNLFSLFDMDSIPKGFGLIGPSTIQSTVKLFETKNSITENGVIVPPLGTFRRCIRLDLSGGAKLNDNTYSAINHNFDKIIANFWKNRMTLVQLGRLYHRNLFKNTWKIPFTKEFQPYSVQKTIVVLGAGTSVDDFIDSLSQTKQEFRKNIFIIAVDVALEAMLLRGIYPDIVIAQESQFAIQAAYANARSKKIHIYADLASRPSVLYNQTNQPNSNGLCNCTGGPISFFYTKFANTSLFKTLQELNIMPEQIIPLGSVGVTATEIALKLRKNKDIPVFVSGLDFSFPAGRTHAKGSMQQTHSLSRQNRLNPIGSPAAAFAETAQKTEASCGFYTDYKLKQYCNIFASKYSGVPNLFKISNKGIPLGIPTITETDFFQTILTTSNALDSDNNNCVDRIKDIKLTKKRIEQGKRFYIQEEKKLIQLKEWLTNGGASQEDLFSMLQKLEYLYVHFPDGYEPSTEIQFLKRVRAEIDFFLKDIRLALKKLNKTEKQYEGNI